MSAVSEDDVRRILREQLYLDVSTLEPASPLFSSGLIDSFSLATLIVELETLGGFRMDPLDITLENLDTIENILRFVSTRVEAGV